MGDHMWPEYQYVQRPKSLLSFSKQEKHDILISIGVLTISFAFAFLQRSNDPYNLKFFVFFALPVAFLAVITGFFLHEMGHRIVARYYGCWAEFRMWSLGLLLALFSSFFGAVFAAPGAVYISGFISNEQNGKISAAGPMMNVLVSLSMFPIIFLGGLAGGIAYFIAYINIFLAGFNLIPFPPLDGYKVLNWGIIPYIGMAAIVVSVYAILVYLL
jgi:Zn-dependent protease